MNAAMQTITPRELGRINGTDQESRDLADEFGNPEQAPVASFNGLVERELKYAMEQFGEFSSAHEAFAVMLEEVDEFWEEVRQKRALRNKGNMLKELVQIAAMAKKTALSLKLIDF